VETLPSSPPPPPVVSAPPPPPQIEKAEELPTASPPAPPAQVSKEPEITQPPPSPEFTQNFEEPEKITLSLTPPPPAPLAEANSASIEKTETHSSVFVMKNNQIRSPTIVDSQIIGNPQAEIQNSDSNDDQNSSEELENNESQTATVIQTIDTVSFYTRGNEVWIGKVSIHPPGENDYNDSKIDSNLTFKESKIDVNFQK
jgi:hypothetical protein